MTHAARDEDGIVARSTERARFLREGRLEKREIAHLAGEIKDLGKGKEGGWPTARPRCWQSY